MFVIWLAVNCHQKPVKLQFDFSHQTFGHIRSLFSWTCLILLIVHKTSTSVLHLWLSAAYLVFILCKTSTSILRVWLSAACLVLVGKTSTSVLHLCPFIEFYHGSFCSFSSVPMDLRQVSFDRPHLLLPSAVQWRAILGGGSVFILLRYPSHLHLCLWIMVAILVQLDFMRIFLPIHLWGFPC